MNFFLPPFSTAVNRGEVYDSALPLMTHPSTKLSRSHNKNGAAGHNFNQTVLLPYEAQPGSITEKLLKTNNFLLQPRRHTDFKPTPCTSGYMRLSTSAEQLQLDARLNGSRSSGSVISPAPPAATVHPVGRACVTFFYYNPPRHEAAVYRAHSYRSVPTEACATSESVQSGMEKLQQSC